MSSIDTYKKDCYAIGCTAQIYRAKLMCSKHWDKVPPSFQIAVNRTLRDWNAGGSFPAYILAIERAQLVVAETENIDAMFITSLRNHLANYEAVPAQPTKDGK